MHLLRRPQGRPVPALPLPSGEDVDSTGPIWNSVAGVVAAIGGQELVRVGL